MEAFNSTHCVSCVQTLWIYDRSIVIPSRKNIIMEHTIIPRPSSMARSSPAFSAVTVFLLSRRSWSLLSSGRYDDEVRPLVQINILEGFAPAPFRTVEGLAEWRMDLSNCRSAFSTGENSDASQRKIFCTFTLWWAQRYSRHLCLPGWLWN